MSSGTFGVVLFFFLLKKTFLLSEACTGCSHLGLCIFPSLLCWRMASLVHKAQADMASKQCSCCNDATPFTLGKGGDGECHGK